MYKHSLSQATYICSWIGRIFAMYL